VKGFQREIRAPALQRGSGAQEGKLLKLHEVGLKCLGCRGADRCLQARCRAPGGSVQIRSEHHGFEHHQLRGAQGFEGTLHADPGGGTSGKGSEVGDRREHHIRACGHQLSEFGVTAGRQILGEGTDGGHRINVTRTGWRRKDGRLLEPTAAEEP
jgi:hypothetical protein